MAQSTTRRNNRQQVAMPNQQPEQQNQQVQAPIKQETPAQGFTIAPVTAEYVHNLEEIQNRTDFNESQGATWPQSAIKEIRIDHNQFPAALRELHQSHCFVPKWWSAIVPSTGDIAKHLDNPTKVLYALGNLDLLKTPCVTLTLTRYTSPTDEALAHYNTQQKANHQARLREYNYDKEVSLSTAAYLAAHGKTIVISTIRDADVPAMTGALNAGGSVIVILPSCIGHSQLDLSEFRKYVEEGRLLFLSQIEEEVTWNANDATARNVTMAAISERVVVLGCTSLNGGTGNLALIAKTLRKQVDVRVARSRIVPPAAEALVEAFGCTKLSGKTYEEALEPLIQ